jgi:hypothetical protein
MISHGPNFREPQHIETAIKDATSKAESNTKSMMDSIKSARDTIDDIAESVDNFHVIRIPLHGWFATSHARILELEYSIFNPCIFSSLFSNFSSTFDILLFKLTISTFPSSEFIVVTKVLEIELLLYLYNFL